MNDLAMPPAPTSFEGLRVTVMGLGRFGGGVGVTRWLVERGATVLVTDMAPAEKLAEPLSDIDDLVRRGVVRTRLGEHNVSDFTDTDAVIANVAVPKPWENRFLRAAQAARVPVTTEIRLTIDRLPARERTIAITGSAGKSTTSAMIHHALRALGLPTAFGGNIGGSLLPEIERGTITRDTRVVLELSSAMLHWLGDWSPRVAVFTNFSPNHLDWHGTLEHYRASKVRILRAQRPGDAAVLGPTLSLTPEDEPLPAGVMRTTVPSGAGVRGLWLPGEHNALNAAVACEAVAALEPGLSRAEVEAAIRTFRGLPHRLELVLEHAGRRYFNDSKSTTPESTLLAVRSFDDAARVHLIVGGYDKGSDLGPVAMLAPSLGGLYTIGKTGPTIAARAREAGGFVLEAGDVASAVRAAAARMGAGDLLLLSPACASWDQFPNYEARGELFAKACRALAEGSR